MELNQFLTDLAEELELGGVALTKDTKLTDLEEWDSLAILSMIAYIDANFSKRLKGTEFTEIETVSDLINLIGSDSIN